MSKLPKGMPSPARFLNLPMKDWAAACEDHGVERIYVSENACSVDPDGMSLADVTQAFAKITGYNNLKFYAEPYGYDGGAEWFIRGDRLENDVEFSIRMDEYRFDYKRKAEFKAAKLEQDRKDYERLKKQFGD